ncbi:hypothetical protein D3C80_2053230 [compost metagenome]
MLQGNNLRTELQLQVFPGLGARQLAKTAHRVRARAVDEQQDRLVGLQHAGAGNRVLGA